jgi:glycerophosphoryl diester phosphodiesterase
MKIISHRGGARLAPENSIEAIRISKTLKVDAVEIDIHISKDDKLVAFHDYSLKRLAGVDKPINTLTLKEIQQIELNNGSNIPTLNEIINAAGDMPLLIEGKGGSWAKLLYREFQKHRFVNKPTIISFNEKELKKFKEMPLDISCCILEIFRGFKAISIAKKYGFEGIDLHYLGLNPWVYKAVKKNNMRLIVYSVNSKRVANYIKRFYPDTEITTDCPDKLLNLVKKVSN